jgi:predicted outer membrane repeat protein
MLTVSNSTFSGNGANHGGGIDVHHSAVIVSNSAVFGNRANGAFGRGGGIYSDYSGTMTVINSTFSDNSATFSGGGIYSVDGAVDVSSSTFSDNSSSGGGGIFNGRYGTLTVSNSTFSGNSAIYGGGGIFNGGFGMLTVSTSTFWRNHAGNRGGGIAIDGGGSTGVINSTLFGNSSGVRGGGIDNSAGSVTIQNTIIANNPVGNNCGGTITDGGGNLSYPDTTCPGINADPVLGPLQDNGGPTWTMALGEGSAALDAADDAICAAPPVNNLDQRGVTRPQGPHCDIGSVEQVPIKSIWLPVVQAR